MDPDFKDPIHFATGISLRKLLTEENEIKLDFNKATSLSDNDMGMDEDEDEEDSEDDEDVLGTIKKVVENGHLASPEYHDFKDLSTRMTECVCPQGGVRILIIEEGTGPLITLDAEVTYHYAAYLEGATLPFDSSLSKGKPLTQHVGWDMLPGLSIGFLNVRGSTARFMLLLEPHMAYMDCGIPPRILPSQTVLFTVTLYDMRNTQAAARFNDLPRAVQAQFDVAMSAIKDIRANGKKLFTKKKYKRAIKSYEQAISIIRLTQPKSETEENEIKDIKVKIFLNLAICYYKEGKPKHVMTMCENIDRYIDINTHCKALYYYGKAYDLLGKTDEAISYFKKALKLEPKNNEIGSTLTELDERTKKSMANEKDMWQKVFNTEKKEVIVYDVDDDFKNSVLDMCQDLAGRNEFTKIDLPNGLTKDEMLCLKSLTSQFNGLVVDEDGTGKKKKISIIKKNMG